MSAASPQDDPALPSFKVCVCGDAGVGKTSLIQRVFQQFSSVDYDPLSTRATIGMDTHRLVVPPDPSCGRPTGITLMLWDAAGQDNMFEVVSKCFWRGAHAVIVVYDICNAGSYAAATQKWLRGALDEISTQDPYVILVGNKLDLATTSLSRQVRTDVAQSLCEAKNYSLMETSAQTGEHVPELFNAVATALARRVSTPAIAGSKGNGGTPARHSSSVRLDIRPNTPSSGGAGRPQSGTGADCIC